MGEGNKMKRISLFFFFLLASLLVIGTYAEAEVHASNQAVKLIIEGKQQNPDVPAELKNNRTFVPIRFIAENMGADVQWEKSKSLVEIKKDNHVIHLTLNSKEIIINGQAFQMDTAPYLEKSRTMVPIRFVSEYLGLDVGWQDSTKTVIINEPVSILINGQQISELRRPMKINDSVYVPMVDLASHLQVSVSQTNDKKGYTFSYTNEAANASVTHTLPVNQLQIIDGQQMAKAELIPQLLGAQVDSSVPNQMAITKEVTYLELSDLSLINGEYAITVPGLQKSAINYFFLDNPNRLVVDLPMTRLADSFVSGESYSLAHGVVNQVRVSQFSSSPMTVRLVFDLNKKASVKVNTAGDQLLFKLEEKRTLVYIDPGHGGHDPGAVGSSSREKDVVLSISNKILKLIEADPDLDVMATRQTDVFLSLTERTDLANQAGADVFLSIHANASPNPSAHGTETYVHPAATDKRFGSIIHKHLVEATGLYNRGLKEANFSVLRTSKMPAALIEIGFISNPTEQKLLNDAGFQDKVAQAMYDAICEYVFGK